MAISPNSLNVAFLKEVDFYEKKFDGKMMLVYAKQIQKKEYSIKCVQYLVSLKTKEMK